MRLLINGSRGRMGQTVVACAKNEPGVEVAGQVDVGDDFAGAGVLVTGSIVTVAEARTLLGGR